MPYFFQFNKDKEIEKVNPRNNSTVNKICKEIEDIKIKRYDFSKTNKFNFNMLMHNKDVNLNEKVVEEYKRLNKEMQNFFFKNENLEKEEIASAVWEIM